MAEEPNGIEDKIVPEKLTLWKAFVDAAISLPAGEQRDYSLSVLAQVGKIIRALGHGLSPAETIKLVDPDTTLIQIGAVVQNVSLFSTRGEEFRLWWNEWHDRVHPDDQDAKLKGVRRLVFNPSQINFKGKPMALVGRFDPDMPLTKNPLYSDLVAKAVKVAQERAGV